MKFSCLISCYHNDSPSYLRDAFSSIVKQSLQPDEVVFVEDGPLTKELNEVVAEFQKAIPIVRVPLTINKGLGYALNYGLLKCGHDVVIRMDADDICHPDRFKTQIEFLRVNTHIDIVGSWAKDINEDGVVIAERKYPTVHKDIYRIIWSCPLIHPSIAFRKKSILKIGSYSETIKRRQDYDLWLRAASAGLTFANIPEFLISYRFTDLYYKKNNLKATWQQAKIGLRGLKRLNVPFVAYIGVFIPVFISVFPAGAVKFIHEITRSFDPRRKQL